MHTKRFPVIDPVATGANIVRLRKERGLTVRDLQSYITLSTRHSRFVERACLLI